MKNNIFITFIIVAVIIYLSVFLLGVNKINCIGNVTFFRGDNKLSLVIKHKMSEGEGVITQSGTLYIKNNRPLIVNQVILFRYTQSNDVIIATSTSIQNSPRHELSSEEEKKWLTDFFVEEGSENTWIIQRVGINSLFFSSSSVPFYICEGVGV